MSEYLLLIVGAVLVNNIVLARYLGNCPFFGVSTRLDTATGVSVAVVFVTTMASATTWIVQRFILTPFELEYLQTIAFILVIATLVQLVEMFLQKMVPALYRALGIFLPLITTNCAVLGIAVLSIQSGEGFPLPSYMPADLGTLFSMVEGIPPGRPVLAVFDYAPGYAGELNAVASPLLEHIILRGLKLATVSTQPTGSPLAEGLLSRVGVNGENYVHLGYLSGGPTAVQLFTAAPRETISRGFLLPENMQNQSGWQSPILQDVLQLSDFSLMVVITASTDSARTWAEQAYPWKGETPLVMVLSVGTEPLIRPYYETLEPQVDGILTGLPSAVTYEQYLGRSGDALARWNAFGAGMLTVELILLAGVIYGAALWFFRPKTVETKSENND